MKIDLRGGGECRVFHDASVNHLWMIRICLTDGAYHQVGEFPVSISCAEAREIAAALLAEAEECDISREKAC